METEYRMLFQRRHHLRIKGLKKNDDFKKADNFHRRQRKYTRVNVSEKDL